MNMRTLLIPLVAAAVLVSGCGHHREIASFGTELYSATSAMTNAIDRAPSADGVTAAYDGFKEKQDRLLEQWAALLSARLSRDDKNRLLTAVMASQGKLTACFDSHSDELRDDPLFHEAMDSLQREFVAHFNLEEIY